MILVIGGARSGKSSFSEEKAQELQKLHNSNVLYIASSIPFDDDMKDRVKKHKEQRPKSWYTLEEYKNFQLLYKKEEFLNSKVILLDCLTLMISNILLEYNGDFDKIPRSEIDKLEKDIIEEILKLINVCNEHNKELIIVSNEVGLGLVPPYRLGSIFRDIAGRANQLVAKMSNDVYLLTAGIPLKIK